MSGWSLPTAFCAHRSAHWKLANGEHFFSGVLILLSSIFGFLSTFQEEVAATGSARVFILRKVAKLALHCGERV